MDIDRDNASSEETGSDLSHVDYIPENRNTPQPVLNGEILETQEREIDVNTHQQGENGMLSESHRSDLNEQRENDFSRDSFSEKYEDEEEECLDSPANIYTTNGPQIYSQEFTNRPVSVDEHDQQSTVPSTNTTASHSSANTFRDEPFLHSFDFPSQRNTYTFGTSELSRNSETGRTHTSPINNITQNPPVSNSPSVFPGENSMNSTLPNRNLTQSTFAAPQTPYSSNSNPYISNLFTATNESSLSANVNRQSLSTSPAPPVQSSFQNNNLSGRTTQTEMKTNSLIRPEERLSVPVQGRTFIQLPQGTGNLAPATLGMFNTRAQIFGSQNTTNPQPNSGFFGFATPSQQQTTNSRNSHAFGGFGQSSGFGFGAAPRQLDQNFGRQTFGDDALPQQQTGMFGQTSAFSFGSSTTAQQPNSGLIPTSNSTFGNRVSPLFGSSAPHSVPQPSFLPNSSPATGSSVFLPPAASQPSISEYLPLAPQHNVFAPSQPSPFNNNNSFNTAPAVTVNDIAPQQQPIRRRNRAVFRSNFAELLRSIRRARMSSAELRGVRDDRKLFIGGLHPSITENDLRQYFQRFGIIESIKLHVDRKTRESRRFAFVVFYSPSVVEMIMSTDNHTIGNNKLYIEKPGHPKPRNKEEKSCAIM